MKSRVGAIAALWLLTTPLCKAQGAPAERIFSQSKPAVEAAVRQLQAPTGGRLPVLDGFAVPGEQPLDRFQKGYYQCSIQVSSTAAGESRVRISAKITAWYNAPEAAKSGYRILLSNGRLEADLLDQLADMLAAKTPPPGASSSKSAPAALKENDKTTASHSAAATDLPSAPSFKGSTFPRADHTPTPSSRSGTTDARSRDLDKETRNLEEILRNQSHPNNLAAVRKSGTPVLVSPSEGAKVLFLAEAEDEFEILDNNESWVHVRISGLSRAWIRRSHLEMPGAAPAEEVTPSALPAPAAPAVANDKAPFLVENEQTAAFPGDWEPLRGKVVRIVSVQKAADSSSDSGTQAKLAFVKGVFVKEYADLTQTASTAAGIVLIFDSSDGGMVATTLTVLRQWKAGTLSDEALWRRCYFDPPEMFHSSGGQ